jgi:hypothetical protein
VRNYRAPPSGLKIVPSTKLSALMPSKMFNRI